MFWERTDRASVHKASWCLKYSVQQTAPSLPHLLAPLAFKARSAVGRGFFFFFFSDFQVRCVWGEMDNTNCPVFPEVPVGSWDSPYRTDPRELTHAFKGNCWHQLQGIWT